MRRTVILRATSGVDTLGAAGHTVNVTVIMRGPIGVETPEAADHIARVRGLTTIIIDTHMSKVIRDTNPDILTYRLTDGRRQTSLKRTTQNHDQRTPETPKHFLVVVRNGTPKRPRRRRTRGVMLGKGSKSPMGKKVCLVV
jgi:hypothetical protein